MAGRANKEEWEKRYRAIAAEFPSVETKVFATSIQHDPDMFSQVMGDLVKAVGARSKPGKRPTLERSVAENELKRLSLSDFSEYPFEVAFQSLTKGRSVRAVAHKTGLSTFKVHEFNHGALPSFEEMEVVAKAYAKKPTFFLEYRIAFVLSIINFYLLESPEVTTLWFLRLKGREKLEVG